jgi:hypothetical protein
MDSDIERLIEATGASLPLAGRMVGMILDSGASWKEVADALAIVSRFLPNLEITFDHRQPQAAENPL